MCCQTAVARQFATCLLDHVLQGTLPKAVGSHQVERQHPLHLGIEVLDGGFVEAVAYQVAGVVGQVVGDSAVADGYVKAAEVIVGRVHESVGFVALGEVCSDYEGLDIMGVANLPRHSLGAIGA